MRITTYYKSDNEFLAESEAGHQTLIDTSNQDKSHMGPMELVLSALCGCVAVEIASMIKKRRKRLDDLKILGDANRRTTAPKSFTDIHLTFILTSPDATVEELTKVATLSLEKYCSVADSLKVDITLSCEVERPD